MDAEQENVAAAMRRITDAWLQKRVEDLAANVHDDVVMVLPGFSGRTRGRAVLLAGFQDFCEKATVHQFREDEHQVDVVGNTAVVTVAYEMVYELPAQKYRATGRDLWVFEKQGSRWLAVWRTMLDVNETAA